MDLKILMWSVALFFGSGLVFKAISDATSSSPAGVTLGLQALAMGVIVAGIVLVVRNRNY